jgi:two-component system, OmpR family, response regulator
MRILVVDDHDEVRSLLRRALGRDGHVVRAAANLTAARAQLAARDVDLVVLDLGLPDGEGLELCRELRVAGRAVPVLVLTARSAMNRRIEGFDAGADDFLAKPFAVAELRARVKALGRRGALPRGTRIEVAGTALDLAARRATSSGREVPVTAREWSILDLLVARDGRLVPRDEILDIVWGDTTAGASASLDVMIGRIRRKLGDDLIRTVRGEGYAFAGAGK